jgi:hypothetical protein
LAKIAHAKGWQLGFDLFIRDQGAYCAQFGALETQLLDDQFDSLPLLGLFLFLVARGWRLRTRIAFDVLLQDIQVGDLVLVDLIEYLRLSDEDLIDDQRAALQRFDIDIDANLVENERIGAAIIRRICDCKLRRMSIFFIFYFRLLSK